jgi:hypothetical protein
MGSIQPASDRAYQDFLQAIKSQVVQSRIGTARAVNRSLIGLYWALGQLIVEWQEALGWGKAVVERLSADLKAEFPEMTGFSPRNLWFIKQFYEAYQLYPQGPEEYVGMLPTDRDWQRLLDLASSS